MDVSESHDGGRRHDARPYAMPGSRPVLIAYLHLRAGVPDATRALLTDYITGYAERAGYELRRVITGVERTTDLLAIRDLLTEIEHQGADVVLVSGPSAHALRALHRIPRINVITLADAARTRR